MGCSPYNRRSNNISYRKNSVVEINSSLIERSCETSCIAPNRKLLLDYYANENSMNKKIKSLFEVIFAKEELEITQIDLSFITLDIREIYHLQVILQSFQNLMILKLNYTKITA